MKKLCLDLCNLWTYQFLDPKLLLSQGPGVGGLDKAKMLGVQQVVMPSKGMCTFYITVFNSIVLANIF